MTASQSEPSLRQMLSVSLVELASKLDALREPSLTLVTLYLAEMSLLFNSKLEEMESRLSALEPGSKQPESKQPLTGSRTIFSSPPYLY